MSYDASVSGGYPSKAGFGMYLYVRRDQTDNPNNRSTYAWSLSQTRNNAYVSWELTSRAWNLSVGPSSANGSSNCDFRAVPNGGERLLATGSTDWIGHDSNGYLNVTFAFQHPYGSSWGTAAGSSVLYTDRIPKDPAAPGVPSYSLITPTTARATFTGSTNDNGAPITQQKLRLSVNSNPDTMPYTEYVGTTVNITGLTPGVTYYGKSYAQNSDGWGLGSAVSSFKTLSGAYVGKSSIFQGAEVLVGKGGVYATASIYVGKGGVFVLAT